MKRITLLVTAAAACLGTAAAVQEVTLRVHHTGRRAAVGGGQVVEGVIPEVLKGVIHDLRRDRDRGATARLFAFAVQDGGDHPGNSQTPGVVLAPAPAALGF